MKPMAVGATGHQGGITQFLNLSMIALVVGLSRDGKNLVPLHHLLVRVAFLADFCMKLFLELSQLKIIALQSWDSMETVAVCACR